MKNSRFKNLLFLLACCFVLPLSAQKSTVTGTVTSAIDQEPLIGVGVVEVGTSNGTTTDLDGKFSISVGKDAKLTFSYIGYNAQTVTVGNRPTIDIRLGRIGTEPR